VGRFGSRGAAAARRLGLGRGGCGRHALPSCHGVASRGQQSGAAPGLAREGGRAQHLKGGAFCFNCPASHASQAHRSALPFNLKAVDGPTGGGHGVLLGQCWAEPLNELGAAASAWRMQGMYGPKLGWVLGLQQGLLRPGDQGTKTVGGWREHCVDVWVDEKSRHRTILHKKSPSMGWLDAWMEARWLFLAPRLLLTSFCWIQ
jgi:hypothetical protein